MKDLYDTTKKLAGKYTRTNNQVNDKEGNILTREDDQLQQWIDYFSELLNRPSPAETSSIPQAPSELEVNCERPSKEEIVNNNNNNNFFLVSRNYTFFCVVKAVKKLKSGKAAGPDNRQLKALKAEPYTTAGMLYELFGKIWEEEKMPTEWNESQIIKLPKKGDMRECKYYRGIPLLTVFGKIIYRVMLMHLQKNVDVMLRDQQAGFRKDCSCTVKIATLRIIIEQSIKWNTSMSTFVDFAFNNLDRNTLWSLMMHYSIPGKFITIR